MKCAWDRHITPLNFLRADPALPGMMGGYSQVCTREHAPGEGDLGDQVGHVRFLICKMNMSLQLAPKFVLGIHRNTEIFSTIAGTHNYAPIKCWVLLFLLLMSLLLQSYLEQFSGYLAHWYLAVYNLVSIILLKTASANLVLVG